MLYGEGLSGSDKFSFDAPVIKSDEDWQMLISQAFDNATLFTNEIAKMKSEKMYEDFADPRYGNYFRNIVGVIEHTHYHIGQIAIIKKILSRHNS